MTEAGDEYRALRARIAELRDALAERGWWRRFRLRERVWAELDGLYAELSVLRVERARELDEDALELARASWKAVRGWHEPTGEHVNAQLRADGMSRSRTPAEWLPLIYEGRVLERDPAVEQMVERAAAGYPVEAVRAGYEWTRKCPDWSVGSAQLERWHGREADAVAAALDAAHALLPEPVIVYRGEHPNRHDPGYAAAVDAAVPGDVLERGRLPLSTSIDPAVAAQTRFTGVTGTTRSADPAADGWMLRIRVDRLLYLGTRNERLGITDGNEREREALIMAPHLRVLGHSEVLVRTRAGVQLIHLVDVDAQP